MISRHTSPWRSKKCKKLPTQLCEQFNAHKIAIHHAEGILKIGDIPVIITVAAPHRKAAFAACQYAINTLKETVPIWKREFFSDGEVW